MLKQIDPLLGPELLSTLRAMGHGDEIVIADANFPAASAGRPLIRLDGIDAPRIANAILSVMPLDDFVPECAWHMQVVGDPGKEYPLFAEIREIVEVAEARPIRMGALERFAFYEAARNAFAIVRTSDPGPYGCFILRKGVI